MKTADASATVPAAQQGGPSVVQPERLDALKRTSLLDSPTEEKFDRLTRLAATVLHAPVSLISLIDEDRQFFKSSFGLPEPLATQRQTPLPYAICQHVVETGEPLLVPDAHIHPVLRDNLAVVEWGVVAYAGIALVTEGQVLGSLCVLDTQPRFWSTKEVAILCDLAAVVMAEIALRTEPHPLGDIDDQLVRLVARHDDVAEAALTVLYERYSASVYGLALQVASSTGLAEDLLQEAFWKLWEQAYRYQPGRVRFATWLLCIARNLAISERRRAARRPPLLHRIRRFVSTDGPIAHDEAVLGRTDGDMSAAPHVAGVLIQAEQPTEELVWLAEQRRAIGDGLQALPLEQRQAVELAYFRGYSHAEIAAAQSAPVSTVKTRLALGLRKLAAHLTQHGITREDVLA